MSIYSDLKDNDIVEMVKPMIAAGWQLTTTGRLTCTQVMADETPWRHVFPHPELNCSLWNHAVFVNVFRARGWVPTHCQSCFKVVARPQTLRQLFALESVQGDLGYPCKCGIELRPTVHGLYGGYWYTRSVEEGRERYRQVRAAVDAHPDLGPDVRVILKRACTEMEHAIGPSDQWVVHPGQLEIEQRLASVIDIPNDSDPQPAVAIAHVHRRWIEFAYQWGDPTYADYTDGEPLHPSYVTYEEPAGL